MSTTTTTTTQTPPPANSSGGISLATFQPGPMAVCSAQMNALAHLFAELSVDDNNQMIESLKEQSSEATLVKNAFAKQGQDDANAMIAQGVGQMVAGGLSLGAAGVSSFKEYGSSEDLNQHQSNIDNAKTYQDRALEKSAGKTPSDSGRTMGDKSVIPDTTKERVEQLKTPGHNFGEAPITTSDKGAIDLADVGSDIRGENGISKNVDSYIEREQTSKSTIQNNLNSDTQWYNNLGSALGNIATSSGTINASGYKVDSAKQQGNETLGNNALTNAQKCTDSASSKAQSEQQQSTAIYNQMADLYKANRSG